MAGLFKRKKDKKNQTEETSHHDGLNKKQEEHDSRQAFQPGSGTAPQSTEQPSFFEVEKIEGGKSALDKYQKMADGMFDEYTGLLDKKDLIGQGNTKTSVSFKNVSKIVFNINITGIGNSFYKTIKLKKRESVSLILENGHYEFEAWFDDSYAVHVADINETETWRYKNKAGFNADVRQIEFNGGVYDIVVGRRFPFW